MKKSFHLFLALVMCLCLCACGDGNRTNPKSTTQYTFQSAYTYTTTGTRRLSDDEVKSLAAELIYKRLQRYKIYDADSCKWQMNKIERGVDSYIRVYARVFLYDKYGAYKETKNVTVTISSKYPDYWFVDGL